ncbi:hypothetical protein [Solicola gregarius]|uniref:DUF559 domain-containing protein n=1 Tax=Solicola gregarius TaxID=2908642 RepID=A0AA46TL45_9ACTN|nr:hypothetical protein [Solicola gregarius]UYM06428.1 hypothetical protein L0C25_04960 [Solicola gregarius]
MPKPRPIPAALRARPFTLAQARECGIGRRVLAGSRFRRLFSGVYISTDWPLDLNTWLEAALLIAPPGTIVTGLTGLRCRGIDIGPRWPLHLATRAETRVRRPHLRITRVTTLPPHDGRLAEPADCFVTACADVDLVDTVTIGDWLLHRGIPRAALDQAVAASHGRGVALARRAMTLVRDRVESPRETYVRLMLVLAGLPEPKCNPNLGSSIAFIGRADLAYMVYRLIVEYDGRFHAEDADNWDDDLDRIDDFADAEWAHIRVTARRLRRPRALVMRVYRRLVQRGYQGPPPVFTDEWVTLFETRTAAERARESLAGSWN